MDCAGIVGCTSDVFIFFLFPVPVWGHVYTAFSFGQQLYLVITLLACMAVRRGAGSGAELQEGDFIDDTSDLPDYDEVVSNWTEFAQGASPRFLQEPEPWSQLRNPVFLWFWM